jgi:CopG-like RHH_1 or ribbon-helix-helix domain, RHH_5
MQHKMMDTGDRTCPIMSKKLNAVVPDDTWNDLEELAEQEMRTKSQMAAILLAEAIAARKKASNKGKK